MFRTYSQFLIFNLSFHKSNCNQFLIKTNLSILGFYIKFTFNFLEHFLERFLDQLLFEQLRQLNIT